jgi:hypothetical protein
MPVPPQFIKKASKRRLDAALPSNTASNTKQGQVATFKNPGNKAGAGLMQQLGSGETPGEAEPGATASNFMAQLKSAPKKKPKTKVQPAASRKILAMRLAAKNASTAP